MSLAIGIIGLPNVGKSTLFNALTEAQNAAVANYPFCTIKPNKAIVHVPDARVRKLIEWICKHMCPDLPRPGQSPPASGGR